MRTTRPSTLTAISEKKLSQNRSRKGTLFPPQVEPTHSPQQRQAWLAKARSTFVQPSKANHDYYMLILEQLWPEGHGLPGPHVSEQQIRDSMDALRVKQGQSPYRDPFRRMRELQGDEGFKSIAKSGKTYQLQSTEIFPKREPRTKPSSNLWKSIKSEYSFSCAKCGKSEPQVTLSPDHRVPRSRGGTGDDLNWQPLCIQCNTLKSAACKDCLRVCTVCFWAYPEKFADLEISDVYRQKIRLLSESMKEEQNAVLDKILKEYFIGK